MKKGSLSAALKEVARPESAAPVKAQAPAAKADDHPAAYSAPSRAGKRAVTGFFDPAVSKQLKHIGLERDATIQDLLQEALNDLFHKYGRPPIA